MFTVAKTSSTSSQFLLDNNTSTVQYSLLINSTFSFIFQNNVQSASLATSTSIRDGRPRIFGGKVENAT